MRRLPSLTFGLLLAVALPLPAQTPYGMPYGNYPYGGAVYGYGTTPIATVPSDNPNDPWLRVRIGERERQVITAYYAHLGTATDSGKKAKGLPPGLQKKVQRGGGLPPGWQARLARGEVLPTAVAGQARPLPYDLRVQLPSPPPGVVTVEIEGKIVRVLQATREIIDVLDL